MYIALSTVYALYVYVYLYTNWSPTEIYLLVLCLSQCLVCFVLLYHHFKSSLDKNKVCNFTFCVSTFVNHRQREWSVKPLLVLIWMYALFMSFLCEFYLDILFQTDLS